MAQFQGRLTDEWGDTAGAPALAGLLRPPGHALGIPDSSDRSFWAGIDPATSAALVDRARREHGTPWPVALAGDYARYFLDGNREIYQDQVFARQDRLAATACATAVTGDPDLLRETLDGVILMCEQSTWCWPAHDDTRERHGSVLPTLTSPYLDLGAGEVVALLAWVDALVGPQLERAYPGVRARVRLEARQRVLTPFLERRDWWWLGITRPPINWSPWIHGNVLTAALQLVDEPLVRARIVASVIEGIDRYLTWLPDDGAVDEGSAYWWQGAGRMMEALERLQVATGGALDATGVPVLRDLVAFPVRMQFGRGWCVNFADAPARPAPASPWRTLFHWGRVLGDASATGLARAHRTPAEGVAPVEAGLARVVPALADVEWSRAAPDQGDGGAPPEHTWLPSIEVAVDRQRGASRTGLTVAAKGGSNDESHNHDDVGSFIVASRGAPVLIDLGQPTYTAQTFGPDRYGIWVMRSEWHNLPVVRGTQQLDGKQFRARETVRVDSPGIHGLQMDLAAAYPRTDLRHWIRRVVLEEPPDIRDGPGDRERGARVVVTDSWQFDRVPPVDGPPLEFHLITAHTVELHPEAGYLDLVPDADMPGSTRTSDPATAHVRPDARVRWESGAATARVEERRTADRLLAAVWGPVVRRIVLTPADGESSSGSFGITIGAPQ